MKKKRFTEEQRGGVYASVTLKVRLFVVIGEVVSMEHYTLRNIEGPG